MTKETQTAINTTEIQFLKKTFDEHCQKQNSSLEKIVVELERNNRDHSAIEKNQREGLQRVYEKIDEQLGKSITKNQALLYGIMGSIVSALIIYTILGR